MKALRILPILLAAALLAGCGQHDRETRLYGPDAAKLAGDKPPWSHPPFNGDELAWNKQEEKRARLLNEYSRIR